MAKWPEERRRAEALQMLLVVDPTGTPPEAREKGAAIEAALCAVGPGCGCCARARRGGAS